jgi:glycosyltransferase involved in cell wall biosynthesis
MDITVVLCTYNRSVILAKALDSLAASTLPANSEWEVLVVDNNSKDQTRTIIEGFCQRHPGRFRYLFEPQQGKSFALNSALREARGDILAFVDDDVTVEPTWLYNLTSILRDGEWVGSAGRILPMPGFLPPRWLALDGPLSLLGALCAYCDLGDLPGELRTPPVGSNMAFRKDMFEMYVLFRTDLGPRPDSEMRHEDTEFGRRLMAAAERLAYVPSAIVYHEIHENRVCKEFFLAWWFDFGRGSVRQNERNLTAVQIFKVLGRALVTTLEWILSFSPRRRFYCKCRLWYAAGKLVEAYQRAMGAEAPGDKMKRRLERV